MANDNFQSRHAPRLKLNTMWFFLVRVFVPWLRKRTRSISISLCEIEIDLKRAQKLSANVRDLEIENHSLTLWLFWPLCQSEPKPPLSIQTRKDPKPVNRPNPPKAKIDSDTLTLLNHFLDTLQSRPELARNAVWRFGPTWPLWTAWRAARKSGSKGRKKGIWPVFRGLPYFPF